MKKWVMNTMAVCVGATFCFATFSPDVIAAKTAEAYLIFLGDRCSFFNRESLKLSTILKMMLMCTAAATSWTTG